MISVRSRLSMRKVSEDSLKMQISPWRRGLYGGISLILLAGLLSGWSDIPFTGVNAGLVFYLLMIIVSLSVAGWNTVTQVDRRRGVIGVSRRLFGVRVAQKEFLLLCFYIFFHQISQRRS